MVLFKYGFIFLAGAGLGAAMAHRGQYCCDSHHRHGPCWRRRHSWDHRGGDDLEAGRRRQHHEQLDSAAASYENERRKGYLSRPGDEGSRRMEEGEFRSAVKKNKKSAATADSDY